MNCDGPLTLEHGLEFRQWSLSVVLCISYILMFVSSIQCGTYNLCIITSITNVTTSTTDTSYCSKTLATKSIVLNVIGQIVTLNNQQLSIMRHTMDLQKNLMLFYYAFWLNVQMLYIVLCMNWLLFWI